MPTDDERREVERRLRMSRSEWSGMGWKLWLGPKFGTVVLSDGNRDELEDAAHRLADLIEPPARCPHYMHPCCRTDAGGDYIDREALLRVADEMKTTMKEAEPMGFIFPWRLGDYARRIREALGV